MIVQGPPSGPGGHRRGGHRRGNAYKVITPTPAPTNYTDNFTRAVLSTSTTPWFIESILPLPVPGGTWAQARAGVTTNQLVLDSYGPASPATKRGAFIMPGVLWNTTMWGLDQYARGVIVSETGTGSFSGVATNVNTGDTGTQSGYILIVRNGQWSLLRFSGGAGTTLIALTAIGGYPATLELQCRATGATQNTLTVLKNTVSVGTSVDNTGIINRTGIPGFYCECQTSGATVEKTVWSSFDGGKL